MDNFFETLYAFGSEFVRLTQLIYGDLLYIFLMILFITCISKLINWIFLIRVTRLTCFNLESSILNKRDFSENLIQYLKKEEDDKLYSRFIGKIIDIAKLINMIFIMYFIFNFDIELFLILFMLNLFSWIGVQLYLNFKTIDRIRNNIFNEDEVLVNYFYNNSVKKSSSNSHRLDDSRKYFDFLNLFDDDIEDSSILKYKMSRLVLSKKLDKEIIKSILTNASINEDITQNININYSKYFN